MKNGFFFKTKVKVTLISLTKSSGREFRPSGKSIIYIKNNSGPKTIPWGTLDVVTTGADDTPSPNYH